MTKLFALALAVAACTAFPGSAHADLRDDDSYSISIPVGDLDLDSNHGKLKLLARIDDAADRICKSNGNAALSERRAKATCKAAFEARAYREVSELTPGSSFRVISAMK